MSDCNYFFDSLGEHTELCNDQYLSGGVPDVLLLKRGHSITDPSDASQITAAISAGEAWLIKSIRVGMPEASPVEVDSPVACGVPSVTRYDRTVTLSDSNVIAENIDLYNTLGANGRFGGLIVHNCGSGKVFWIDNNISFKGGLIIPESDTEYIRFEYTGDYRTGKDAANPMVYDAPTGVFTA